MGTAENFRQYAADCVRQAEAEQQPQDKNILLNVALAWIRLAQQSQAASVPIAEAQAGAPPADEKGEAPHENPGPA